MKKVLGLLLCATMLLGLLAGCSGNNTGNNTTGNNTGSNTTTDQGGDTATAGTVAYLTPSLDVPFWRYVRHGIEDELNKNGMECVVYDSKDDANTQLSNAQDAISAVPTMGSTVTVKVGSSRVQNGGNATWSQGENVVSVTVNNGKTSKVYTVTVTKS